MHSRGPVILLLAGCALAALVVAIALGTDERALVANSGAAPTNVISTLEPGKRACTAPVTPPEDFARVRIWTRNIALPAPALELSVRRGTDGPVLARGVVEGGYRGGGPRTTAIPRTRGRRSVVLCARNTGAALIALLGDAPPSRAEVTTVDGKRLRTALAYDLLRSEPRSGLALVSTVFRRAALFRPAGVGAWTYWVLVAVVLLGVPALLARALADADASEVLGDAGCLATEDVGAEHERSEHHRRGQH